MSDRGDLELSVKKMDLASLWGLNGGENCLGKVAGWRMYNLGVIKLLLQSGRMVKVRGQGSLQRKKPLEHKAKKSFQSL